MTVEGRYIEKPIDERETEGEDEYLRRKEERK